MNVDVQQTNYTRQVNTGYVAPPNKDMTGAQLDEVQRQASARVVEAKVETSKIERQAQESKAAPGTNPEAKIYGEIASNVLGIKALGTAVEILDTRRRDRASAYTQDDAGALKPSRTFDEDIFGASRKPGTYRAPVEAQDYAGTKTSFGKAGMGVVEKSNLTGLALRDAGGEDNLKTWAKKPFEEMKAADSLKDVGLTPKLELAKTASYEHTAANEKVLESVQQVRQQHEAMFAQARHMAPPGMSMGFDLSQGPRIRPQELLSEMRSMQETSTSGQWAS